MKASVALARRALPLLLSSLLMAGAAHAAQKDQANPPKYPNFPSDTPADFKPVTGSFDFTRREVLVPMRDGIKLHTVILIPKGVTHAGIVLTRTPYNADGFTSGGHSGNLGAELSHDDDATDVLLADGYIRVVQDVRGKYGSEGDYVMNRPVKGPQNPTPVSDSTDANDTINWLVKHVPESNGKVAIMGISYDGFEALAALVDPSPALKVAIPENPMADGWHGDDWFHNGAFRQQMMPYIYEQSATRSNKENWWSNYSDDYNTYLEAGNASNLAKQYGMGQLGFWNKVVKHAAYDAFWQDQAMDKILAKQPLTVPVMLVAGQWDQEDIYGAMAVYKALKKKDPDHTLLHLVLGPWYHGQEIRDGSALGPVKFDSDTSLHFRQKILKPFLAHYLKDDAPAGHVAPVNAFVTGVNRWEQLQSFPACEPSGCSISMKPLYLQADNKLGFDAPASASGEGYDQYISDPAKPVPYRARPVPAAESKTWHSWLVGDQREFETRPDVLTYQTGALTQPVRITGTPVVHLSASTSGTDSDWVVKLIDVYPQQNLPDPDMSGYELGIGMDIFRGRYRTSLEHPSALTPNVPLAYTFNLPTADHVFLPGHRIMVQIQSSWFPLYDRNPQTFVPNIFDAPASAYQKATQRVYRQSGHSTYIELPVASASGQ